MPLSFCRNGTFMAYRKLHQNVAAFRAFIAQTAPRFGAVFGINNPDEARETLMAKIAGRWPDGVPVARAPTVEDWKKFKTRFPDVSPRSRPQGLFRARAGLIRFSYADDTDGLKCPVTVAYAPRQYPRRHGAHRPRRIGAQQPPPHHPARPCPTAESPDGVSDADEHGMVMLIVCASLFRQFEFVQQQWINYGLDARAGNDSCPLVGNHSAGGAVGAKTKFVVPADPNAGHPPFLVEGIPQFVETRGGDYFFVPSLTALRMIGMGVVDPT